MARALTASARPFAAIRFTGYGEAVRILAHEVYGMADFSGDELDKAQEKLTAWRQPGGRHELLSQIGRLDHVQTDDFSWPCTPDESGVDFFLYDLSWAAFCNGQIDAEAIEGETGVAVTDLASLKQGMEAIFDQHGPHAIAVKAQHAYNRTLRWEERADADAERVLQHLLQGTELDEPSRLLLGDWCWARGTELAIEYELPFKIHTGYYAGNDRMPVDRIKSGNLCPLLARYLDCRFVLMHIAYPYSNELVRADQALPQRVRRSLLGVVHRPVQLVRLCAPLYPRRTRVPSSSPLAATLAGRPVRWPTRFRRVAGSPAPSKAR